MLSVQYVLVPLCEVPEVKCLVGEGLKREGAFTVHLISPEDWDKTVVIFSEMQNIYSFQLEESQGPTRTQDIGHSLSAPVFNTEGGPEEGRGTRQASLRQR
jgi:hypothetical protein